MAESKNQLGDYLILEKIAQGGMAQVFKAKTTDPNGIERLVVIKRILPHISSSQEYVDMLIDEAKIAVHFTHGNIAQVYDLGKVGDDYFIVMEYVDGKTLSQILRDFRERKEPIPLDVIAHCMIEMCNGLAYIHDKKDADGKPLGIVHRDISPQNIIVSYSGTVKVIDFGVAKSMEKSSHTESGVLKGKYAYMSPEQAEGSSIDNRSDLFSAGVLLWELLTQERLFKRKNNQETIKAVQKAVYTPASKFRPDIPKSLDKIIAKALERKAGRRYQNASEMADDLHRFLIEFNPEFRPLNLVQFLYRYFGPEADEKDLTPELPQLAVPYKPKPVIEGVKENPPEEEITAVDHEPLPVDNLKRSFKRKVLVGIVGFILILVSVIGLYQAVPAFHPGTLQLQVKPKEAQIFVEGKSNLSPKDGTYEVSALPGVPLEIQANLAGYEPYKGSVTLKRDEVKRLSINLKKEIPPFGEVSVDSNPPGAKVYLNNMEWNIRTPVKIPQLKNGQKYKIGVFLEGYKFEEREVTIDSLSPQKISVDLAVHYGSLEISSSPLGASVIIDDQEVGKTPYANRFVKPGEVIDFKIEFPGHKPMTSSVTIQGGEAKQLSFPLEPVVPTP